MFPLISDKNIEKAYLKFSEQKYFTQAFLERIKYEDLEQFLQECGIFTTLWMQKDSFSPPVESPKHIS